jgi:uncharacterized protein YcaQ
VCPLLHRGRLVGRFEGHTEGGEVVVDTLWTEPGVRLDRRAFKRALERLRLMLKTLTEAKYKDLDSALDAADRAELRLSGERKTIAALKGLGKAADLAGYLSALSDTAASSDTLIVLER